MGLGRALAWGALFVIVGVFMIVFNGAVLNVIFASLSNYYIEHNTIPPHVFIEYGLFMLLFIIPFIVAEYFILRRIINNLKQTRRTIHSTN